MSTGLDLLSSIQLSSGNSEPLASPSLLLNKWYITDPRREANCYRWKALGANTLAAITLVAAIALASSIVIFSFLAASGTAIPLGIALGGAAGALLVPVSGWLRIKGNEYSARAEKEQRITEIHRELLRVSLEDLNAKTFLQACGIEITEEKIKLIEQHLPAELSERAQDAYLFVLARFLYACEHANQLKVTQYPSPKRDWQKYENLHEIQKNAEYQKYWEARERGIYPSVLTAILMRAILEDPFRQEAIIENLGSIREKSYIARKLDPNDTYFVLPEQDNPYINMKDIKPVKKIISSYEGLDAQTQILESEDVKNTLDTLQEQLLQPQSFEEITISS